MSEKIWYKSNTTGCISCSEDEKNKIKKHNRSALVWMWMHNKTKSCSQRSFSKKKVIAVCLLGIITDVSLLCAHLTHSCMFQTSKPVKIFCIYRGSHTCWLPVIQLHLINSIWQLLTLSISKETLQLCVVFPHTSSEIFLPTATA